MEIIKPVDIKTWSILGQRGTFGTAILNIAEKNPKIVALSADLCNTSGLDRFQNKYPERFTNVGIAEQNLIGVAAGMADFGSIPFATTFANFATLRACEMLRHFLGYMKCNVKVVGLGAGFAMEFFGNTHYGLEDIAAISAIPNIVVLSPADGLEVMKCIEAAADIDKPVYIRLTGVMNQPIVYKNDFDFVVGKAIEIESGDDVAIIATGSMVDVSVKAAQILSESNISCSVIDMHTVKPIDRDIIINNFNKKLIITVEEHSVIGGLGTAVADVIAEFKDTPYLLKIGAESKYYSAGSYKYMLEQCGLTSESVAEKIKNKLLGE